MIFSSFLNKSSKSGNSPFSFFNNFLFSSFSSSKKLYKEKLREIYELIKNKEYEKKPNDVYLNTVSNILINDKYKKILEKISNITQYSLISSIELIYKFNYEKTNKTSNELDKCSICQYNFYEEDEDINNKIEKKEKKIE